jgi:hypothetical protein
MANKQIKFTFQAPATADGAFELEATGGYTGDLLHVHQHTGSPVAGTDLIHAEAASVNVLPLRLTAATAGTQAATITGLVSASGFSGPLTGNASTATALSTAGSANQFWKNGNVWGQPAFGDLSGSATAGQLPDATGAAKGAIILTGDLGGTAASPSVVDDSHAHTSTTISALDASNDFTIGTMPQTRGGTGAGALTCSAGQHITSNGTAYSCSPDAYTLTALTATVLGGVKGTGAATACSGGQFALGFDAAGALTCSTPSGGGAPTTYAYWGSGADATLSAEKDLSTFTGLVLNTAGTPTSKGTNTCSNQFARSDTASGVWTCAGVGVADFTANQGTTTQVLHGNAAGQPSWGGLVTADLPTVTVAKGGTGLTTIAADNLWRATATDTVSATAIGACTGSGKALTYDTAAHTFGCNTIAAPTMTRLAATWASSATANTLGIVGTGTVPMTSPTYAAAGIASFRCVMSVTRQATTNGPRYGLTTSGTITRASWVSTRGLTATTQTVAQVIVAPTTGTCTTGCDAALGTTVAQVMTDVIEGTVVMNATGTLSLQMAPQAAAAVTAQAGSYCLWY